MGHPTDKSRRMHFTVASLRDSAELLALTVVVAVFVLLSAARSSAAESAKEADASDAIPGSQLPASGDSGLVRATDRSPRPGTPLIANKLFPMGLTLEITPTIDYAYSEKWISHIGGHLSLGFHIFEWLGVEAFAGGFYPRELAITTTVREKGHTVATCAVGLDCDPKLSGLWQSFAFGGAVVEWAPLYGKLSIVSEFDLSFHSTSSEVRPSKRPHARSPSWARRSTTPTTSFLGSSADSSTAITRVSPQRMEPVYVSSHGNGWRSDSNCET